MKLSELANPSLGQALQSLAHKELDMKTAWAVTKLLEDRQGHLKTLESTRNVLLEKYCEKDDAGKFKTDETKSRYLIMDETEYNKEYEELTNIEVECSMLNPEMVDKVGSITPAHLLALKPFIC